MNTKFIDEVIKKYGGEVVIVVLNKKEKSVIGIDAEVIKDPGIFGIIIADIVKNVARAYAEIGHDEVKTLLELRKVLLAELHEDRPVTEEVKSFDA